jgi:hypothetical protein
LFLSITSTPPLVLCQSCGSLNFGTRLLRVSPLSHSSITRSFIGSTLPTQPFIPSSSLDHWSSCCSNVTPCPDPPRPLSCASRPDASYPSRVGHWYAPGNASGKTPYAISRLTHLVVQPVSSDEQPSVPFKQLQTPHAGGHGPHSSMPVHPRATHEPHMRFPGAGSRPSPDLGQLNAQPDMPMSRPVAPGCTRKLRAPQPRRRGTVLCTSSHPQTQRRPPDRRLLHPPAA